jgi:hypothetical protein
MAILRTGLDGLPGLNRPNNTPQSDKGLVVVGRVSDIILNEKHPKFNTTGLDLDGIGLVYFENLGSNATGESKTAKPFYANTKNYPIIGEYVLCFFLPVPTQGAKRNLKKEYYYINSINLWSTPHYNGLPSYITPSVPFFQQQSYQQVEAGAYTLERGNISGSDTPSNLNLLTQNTFVEKDNIQPLMPFAGDVIHEGRFGNSIRLGNTSKSNSIYANNWSSAGKNGDPITILRNGSPPAPISFIPTTEDINQDLSSIYLTSYQSIDLKLGTNALPTPSAYKNPQILLNSNRLVFNAKDDILISGQNLIDISSPKFSLYSNNITLSGTNITIGSNSELTQPVLLGNKTIEVFNDLIDIFQTTLAIMKESNLYEPDKVALIENNFDYLGKTLKPYINKVNGGIRSSFVKSM